MELETSPKRLRTRRFCEGFNDRLKFGRELLLDNEWPYEEVLVKIGIIGAGNIGATPTRRLTVLGHQVTVANSRGPEPLSDLAAETGQPPRRSARPPRMPTS